MFKVLQKCSRACRTACQHSDLGQFQQIQKHNVTCRIRLCKGETSRSTAVHQHITCCTNMHKLPKKPFTAQVPEVAGLICFLRSKDMTIFSISHPGPQGCGQRIASLLHASGGSIGPDGSATIPQQRRKTRIETPQVHDNIFEYLQDL